MTSQQAYLFQNQANTTSEHPYPCQAHDGHQKLWRIPIQVQYFGISGSACIHNVMTEWWNGTNVTSLIVFKSEMTNCCVDISSCDVFSWTQVLKYAFISRKPVRKVWGDNQQCLSYGPRIFKDTSLSYHMYVLFRIKKLSKNSVHIQLVIRVTCADKIFGPKKK
jgi:hypothetical protein